MEDGSYLQDNTGHTVMTFLNEDMCKEIAQAGKGSYIHVDNTSDAEKLLDEDLERLQRGETDTVIYSEYNEQFQAFALLAILVLIIEACILEIKNPILRKYHFFKRQ